MSRGGARRGKKREGVGASEKGGERRVGAGQGWGRKGERRRERESERERE